MHAVSEPALFPPALPAHAKSSLPLSWTPPPREEKHLHHRRILPDFDRRARRRVGCSCRGESSRQGVSLRELTKDCEQERDQHLQTLADLAGRNAKSPLAGVDTAHRSRRWNWADLLEVHERKYLFRNVSLELFFADGQSFLLTFAKDRRASAQSILAARNPAAVGVGSLNVTGSTFGAKFSDAVLGQRTKLEQITKQWEMRLMSNFECESHGLFVGRCADLVSYSDLMRLNTLSGRTYNDLTNYMVMPWILADYTSETVRLVASPPISLARWR
jgi:hypothetical protein